MNWNWRVAGYGMVFLDVSVGLLEGDGRAFIYSFIATFMFAALGDLLLCCITLPL